jgi:hypothetical protein
MKLIVYVQVIFLAIMTGVALANPVTHDRKDVSVILFGGSQWR